MWIVQIKKKLGIKIGHYKDIFNEINYLVANKLVLDL